MLAFVLLRLARIWGDDELERAATGVFRLLLPMLARAPSAFGWTLAALDLHLSPPRELALLAEPGDEIARAALAGWDPHAVVAFGPDDEVPLLAGKSRVDGRPTLYECERFACRAPVTDADAILTNPTSTLERLMGMRSVMKRVLSFGAIVGVALLAGLTPAPRSTAAEAPVRPNIVVVMSDDQTVESMRVMANVNAMLGAEGTTFVDNYVSFPLCCPSRTTFLTGQYGHNHTVMGNAPPQGGWEKLAPTHANTLPAWLKLAGYHTVAHRQVPERLRAAAADGGAAGLGRVVRLRRPEHVPVLQLHVERERQARPLRHRGRRLPGRRVHGEGRRRREASRRAPGAVLPVRRVPGAALRRAARVGRPGESRNACSRAPAPEPFRDRADAADGRFNEADVSDKPLAVRRRPLFGAARINGITEMYRQRLESILAVDEGVAAIVRALQDSGELARTLFVYTSDNGFFHGEHRIPNGKVQHYEPSVRVPLIMRGPGVPRGVRLTQPSINVDLAPTLVDAANAKVGRPTDGVSLLALLADRTRFVGRDVLLETPTYAAIHTPRYVYVEHNTGERELYDLKTDPDELASLHDNAAYAQIRSDLARRLLTLRACKAAACRKGRRSGVEPLHRQEAPRRARRERRPARDPRGLDLPERAAGADAKRPFQVVSPGQPASCARTRRSTTAGGPRSTVGSLSPAERYDPAGGGALRSRTSPVASAVSSRSTECPSTSPRARSSG